MKKIILSVMCLYAVNVFASQEVDVDFSQPQKPNQIATAKSVAVSLNEGAWSVSGDKAVWSYSFNTPNATSMGFSATADLPAGSVVKAGNDFLTRTYTTDLINGGVLNGVPVKGNTLTITVEVPAGQQGSASFAVNEIYAGNTVSSVQPKADFSVKALDSSAPTSPLNYACVVDSTTLNAERSTVDIIINEGQDTIQCTGSLVNDVPSSKKHNILTAAHCGTSNSWNASQVTVLWGRQNQCALGLEDASSIDGPMSTGYTTTAVVTQVKVPNNVDVWDGDMWLLQSPTAPPVGSNPYWAGVNAVLYVSSTNPQLAEYGTNEPALGLTNVYNVSHPLGVSKAYAFSPNPVVDGEECVGLSCTQDDIATYDVNFTTGLLEEGSSGSALYDQNNLLIGSLTGCGTANENGVTTPECDFANIAENWLGNQSTTGKNSSGYYTTVKEVLDPSNTGTLTYSGLEDTSRTDNLTVFLNSDVVTASAGGTVNLSLFTSEAVSCTASSSPAVSGWNGALTVNNGNSVATAVTIPSSTQYTLSVSCVNSANFTVTQDVVINSTGGSSSGGSSGGSSGSSSGGTSGGSSSGSSSGGSTSSSGSGGGSGGGGGAFDLFTLFPLLGMMLLRKKQA